MLMRFKDNADKNSGLRLDNVNQTHHGLAIGKLLLCTDYVKLL